MLLKKQGLRWVNAFEKLHLGVTTMLTNPSLISYCFNVSNKKSSLFPFLIITTIAIGLYLSTLKNGFVYDDISLTIVNNTFISRLDNLPLLLDKTVYFNRSGEVTYRPIVTLTYFIDYALFGLAPWGYHLTNVLLHTINGALLYLFFSLLRNKTVSRKQNVEPSIPVPLLATLIFVTHPVLTEAVNCISYREDLLVFLFYITTLSLYLVARIKSTTTLLYFLSYLTYILALLSKEMAITLPLIIICYEWLYRKEKTIFFSRISNRYFISYIMITTLYLYLRFYLFYNHRERIHDAWGLNERVLTLPSLIISYLKLSFIPVQLSADYVINPVTSSFSPIFILSIIALISIFTIIVTIGNKERGILFGALFFLMTLIPVYNLVPIANPFAERYLYLPMAGFVLFLGLLLSNLISAKSNLIQEHNYRSVPIIYLILLIIFSFSTIRRNAIWENSFTLWSDTLTKMPNSSRAHNNMGVAYHDQGRLNEAVGAHLTAIQLDFKNAKAHASLGMLYTQQGRYSEAIHELKTALSLNATSEAYNTLGIAYLQQGLVEQAIDEFVTAIRLKADNAEAYDNLGNAYARQGRLDLAIKEFLISIRLKPDDANSHYNLGLAYFEQESFDMAIDEFNTALKLKPDYKEAADNLKVLKKEKVQ